MPLCFTWRQSRSRGPVLEVGVGVGRTVSTAGAGLTWAVRQGRGEYGSASGPGLPSCALRARHCSWECSFRGLLGPRRLASSEQSGGAWTTGKGTGTRRSREPRIPPSVCTVSEPTNMAVAEKPRLWGQGFYRFTPSHKAQTHTVFPSSLVFCFLQAWRG